MQPLLQSKVMQLHPVVVLLAVLLGGGWFGIVGAFLAVPVAASIAVVLRYLGDLIDLRTGDRLATDIDWVTDDGHSVGSESERAAAFFRTLVSRRSADGDGAESVEPTAAATGSDPAPTLSQRLLRRGKRRS